MLSSGQVVVPEELRFPHACCVGIASQTTLSLFNPSDSWQKVSITVTSLAIDGEKVTKNTEWLLVLGWKCGKRYLKNICSALVLWQLLTRLIIPFRSIKLKSSLYFFFFISVKKVNWFLASSFFSNSVNAWRWTVYRTSGSSWRTRQLLAPRLQRSRRCCLFLQRQASTSVSSPFAPGQLLLRQRSLSGPMYFPRGWSWSEWRRTPHWRSARSL